MEWRSVSGYTGLYEVSNEGIVRSLSRVVKRRTTPMNIKERILKPYLGTDGYYYVVLSKDGVTKSFAIHRLVLIAFVDNHNNLPCVNHKDENKLNNNLNNLEWCTYSYNLTYNGLTARRQKNVDYKKRAQNTNWEKRKQNTDFAKRTANTDYKSIALKNQKKVMQINIYDESVVKVWDCVTDIAKHYNVTPERIRANCLGSAKITLGYKWRYVTKNENS